MADNSNSEIWKSVPGYPGYEASTEGRVRSLPRLGGNNRSYGGIILRAAPGPRNSPYVTINIGRPQRTLRVHQIILLTFRGPKPSGMWCCHNNGNKTDNRLENLRYDTPKSNMWDRALHGTDNSGERHGMSKLSDEDARSVIQASIELERKLADRFGVTESCIRSIIFGRTRRRKSQS